MSKHFFPRVLSRAEPGLRSIVLVSDVEMGIPGPQDDFPHDGYLAELFETYTKPPYDGVPVDLVLNGDTLDFLKVPYQGHYTRHITADIALARMETILDAHPGFIQGLKAFGEHPSGNKRIHVVTGNHDPEWVFPEIRQRLRDLLPNVAHLNFPGFALRLGPVHIEHGHQYDTMFAVDPGDLFGIWEGSSILKLPWCSAALLDAVFPYRDIFCAYDRLRPRTLMFERWPMLKEITTALFKAHFQSYLRHPLAGRRDPGQFLTWPMVKQLAVKAYTNDADAGIRENDVLELLINDPQIEVAAFAHLHRPTWTMIGTRQVIHTGCMRDEFEIDRTGETLRPIPKSYGEIILDADGHARDVRLLQASSPAELPTEVFQITDAMQAVYDDVVLPKKKKKQKPK